MTNRFPAIAVPLGLLLAAPAAHAQDVSFQFISNALSANDLSPDGRYVVGTADQNGDGFADGNYIWDLVGGVQFILPTPAFDATAVSDDGNVIVGCIPDPDPMGTGAEVAGLWNGAAAWSSLGYLPFANACPSLSNAYEVNGAGTVVVGLSWDGCGGRGFRWTQAGGMIELQNLAFGVNRASVVSDDGNVIGGFAQGQFNRTPAVWDGTGAGQTLDPTAAVVGEVHGMSDDGSILLVEWDGDAATWTSGGGVQVLGDGTSLPGWIGIPMDIADDGTVVGFDILLGNRVAWIQPQGVGPLRNLESYIVANGGTVPDEASLEVCQAISADGRTIVGHGFVGNAWRITITPDCEGDTDGSGAVDIDDVVNVILCFGTDGVDCPSPGVNTDVVPNGVVDIDDVIAVVLNFGTCPGT